jgi:hypothetical protein
MTPVGTRVVRSAAALTILILSVASETASAQNRRDRHVVDGGRVAGIAAAPVPVVVVAPPRHRYYGGYGYAYGAAAYSYFPNAGLVQNIPVFMLQDGRVFANFGYGFESVVRTCAPTSFGPAVTNYGTVTTIGSTIVQPSPVQPVVTQPAPAQRTASEQMLVRALSPAAVVTTLPGPLAVQVVTPSCWSSYGGNVFVFRR